MRKMEHLNEMLFRIKYEMKQKNITIKQVAKELGYTQATISNLLNGNSGTFDTLKKILKYLETK
jgi:transcriptional regulator with XRE-family HTH domain